MRRVNVSFNKMLNHRVQQFFMLTLFSLLLSSSFAQDVHRKINLKADNKTLAEVIQEIGRQGDIHFSYNPKILPGDSDIIIEFRDKSIKEILDALLVDYNLSYKVIENQVVIKKRKKGRGVDGTKRNQTISGFIRDKATGEVLIGANVYVYEIGQGASTNAYGFYSLSLPKKNYRIRYSFVGYNSVEQDVELNVDLEKVVVLELSSLEMETVEIKDEEDESTLRSNQLGEMKLSPQALSKMPGFAGDVDVVKSLNTIPGVNTYGDGSTLFYVRGGHSDQNLLLVDEAPIYNPSHLFGFFTALSPDAIKDVKVYKGDYPASLGGRLSSVIEIRTREGNMKRMGFSGNLGIFASSLTVEGPIIKDKASFLISGRRSNLNWISKLATNSTADFKFNDINLRTNYQINSNNRLFFSFFSGNDDFSLKGLATSSFGISWDNKAGTLRWNHVFNNRLFSNSTMSFSQYNYYLYISKEQNDYWNSGIENFTLKSDFTYYMNPQNTIRTGLALNSFASNPGNIHFSDDEIQRYIPEVARYNSLEYVFYLENNQNISERLSMRYGFRTPVWTNRGATTVYYFDPSYQVIGQDDYAKGESYYTKVLFEPRFSMKYIVSENVSIKMGYNRTSQFNQILSNSTSPFTSLEVWAPSGPNIKPQIADQLAVGYFNEFGKRKWMFSMEGFYKRMKNQIGYKEHPNLLYNPLIEGELRFGEVKSYGMEFLLRKKAGKLSGWIAYTWSRALKEFEQINNGEVYPAFYDRPHDVCVNLHYQSSGRWSFSANWFYLSGSAITTPTGFYQANGYTVPIYSEKNNDRLPDYHRLDFTADFRLNRPGNRYQHNLLFTLYNAYGQNNPFSVNFNKMLDEQGKYVVPADLPNDMLLEPTIVSVAGVIFSMNYSFKF